MWHFRNAWLILRILYGTTARRNYEWIAKGGEELRIDQRVEQLLGVMNGLLDRHPPAAAHHLQVAGAVFIFYGCCGSEDG